MDANRDERFTMLLHSVRTLMAKRLAGLPVQDEALDAAAYLAPGKMLRTRLAARVACALDVVSASRALVHACAATEMAHTASLCHDDLIDGAIMRRGRATIWRVASPAQAVLTGDLLLCEAIDVLLDADEPRLVQGFVAKLRETCAAEAEHELHMRHGHADATACTRVARGKTGPLFAFPLTVLVPDQPGLSQALEQAGYHIGTAYQLADDLLDVTGCEASVGKTLGTDRLRCKPTLASVPGEDVNTLRDRIAQWGRSALDLLSPWPCAAQALHEFLAADVQPIFELCGLATNTHVRCAV